MLTAATKYWFSALVTGDLLVKGVLLAAVAFQVTAASGATLIEIEGGDDDLQPASNSTKTSPTTRPTPRVEDKSATGSEGNLAPPTSEEAGSGSSSGLFAPYEKPSTILSLDNLPHWSRVQPDWYVKPMAGYYESLESFYDRTWQASSLELGGRGGLVGIALYEGATQLTLGVELGGAYGQVITSKLDPPFASFERRWLGVEATWLAGPWRLELGGTMGHKEWHKSEPTLPVFRSFRFKKDIGLLLKAANEQMASVHLNYTEVRGLYQTNDDPFIIRRNLWPHLKYQFKTANFASGPGFLWQSLQQAEVPIASGDDPGGRGRKSFSTGSSYGSYVAAKLHVGLHLGLTFQADWLYFIDSLVDPGTFEEPRLPDAGLGDARPSVLPESSWQASWLLGWSNIIPGLGTTLGVQQVISFRSEEASQDNLEPGTPKRQSQMSIGLFTAY